MSHFQIVHPTVLLYRFMHSIPNFKHNSMKFGKHSMSMTVCHHMCYFEFVIENKDIFLLYDHIWKCQNLNDRIS